MSKEFYPVQPHFVNNPTYPNPSVFYIKPGIFYTKPPVFFYDHEHPGKLVLQQSEISKISNFLISEFSDEVDFGKNIADLVIELLKDYKQLKQKPKRSKRRV